ncbi:putative zinc finger protein [Orchesella cincta]|uniref:Putative zinc finger protein n=1 Tax=Orchesella cincta TaxID=48709 RepID=A0A1D2MDN6_ORCCI|nr:putative zinc finger protein [Orchesella cincta]
MKMAMTQRQCLLCGDYYKGEVNKVDINRATIFQCFCKLFLVTPSNQSFWRVEEGGKEFPFCEQCSSQLITVWELQRKLEELVVTLREKLDGGEKKFETGSAYQEDRRLYEIRREILGGETSLMMALVDDDDEEKCEEFIPEGSSDPVKLEPDLFDIDAHSPNEPHESASASDHETWEPSPKTSRKRKGKQNPKEQDSSTSFRRPRRQRKVKEVTPVIEEDDDDEDDEDFNPSSEEQDDDNCTCKFCYKKLSSPRNLKLHIMNLHTGVPPELTSTCSICSKPFPRRCSYKRHLWSHFSQQDKEEAISRGEKPPAQLNSTRFQCELCPYSCGSPFALTRHQETHASNPERLQLCPLCGVSVIRIKQHMRFVHENVKKYSCTICKKGFKQPSLLKIHRESVHSKEKKWKCELCPREFGFEVRLKEHLNSHLGIRPFPCSECSSAFTTKGMLKRHHKTYHEEGSRPGRPSYVRGPEKIKLEERKCVKKGETHVKSEKKADFV